MDLGKLKQDMTKVTKGVEHHVTGDFYITLAKLSSPDFTSYLRELSKPHQRSIRNKTADDSVFDKLYNKAVAKKIILGWRGLTEGGKPVPHSVEKAEELLNNPEYEAFKNIVLDLAGEDEAYRAELVEATVKK